MGDVMRNMGIGRLGDTSIMKSRKFRWTLQMFDEDGDLIVSRMFVKLASRPNLNIEETELDYLNNKSWIAGKNNWQTANITLYDIEDEGGKQFVDYIFSIYNQNCQSLKFDKMDYLLELWDGCGFLLESWNLKNGFVTAFNFSQLDHSSSELTTCEIDVRYMTCEYKSYCVGVGSANPVPEVPQLTDQGKSVWKMPDKWVIHNPIFTESSSLGERILDQFLHRSASTL